MKKLITIVVLMHCYFFISAQKPDLKLEGSKVYANQDFEYQLIERFKSKNYEKFSFNYNALNTLSVQIDKSKVLKLEGLTNSFTGTGKIKFYLKDGSFSKDTSWTFSTSVKGSSDYEISSKLISNFESDLKGMALSTDLIKSFLLKNRSQNCQVLLEDAQKEMRNKNWQVSYRKANMLLGTKCEKEAEMLKSAINEEYSKEFCEDKLPRIKILANSGIDYKMDLAIEELLRFPSKAKCKDEVLSISKGISEYLLKKPQGNKKIEEINTIIIRRETLDFLLEN